MNLNILDGGGIVVMKRGLHSVVRRASSWWWALCRDPCNALSQFLHQCRCVHMGLSVKNTLCGADNRYLVCVGLTIGERSLQRGAEWKNSRNYGNQSRAKVANTESSRYITREFACWVGFRIVGGHWPVRRTVYIMLIPVVAISAQPFVGYEFYYSWKFTLTFYLTPEPLL